MPAEQTQTPSLVTEQARVVESMTIETSESIQIQEPKSEPQMSIDAGQQMRLRGGEYASCNCCGCGCSEACC